MNDATSARPLPLSCSNRCYYSHVVPKPLLAEVLAEHGWQRVADIEQARLVIPPAGKAGERWKLDWQPQRDDQVLAGLPNNKLFGRRSLWLQLELALGREHASQVVPESYLLDCFEHLDKLANDLRRGGVFFIKSTRQHQREGLTLTSDWNDIATASRKQCMLAQRLMQDVLRIQQHRLSLRMYLVVGLHRGLVRGWLHQDGRCLYAPKPDVGNCLDLDAMVTRRCPSDALADGLPFTIVELARHLEAGGQAWGEVFESCMEIMGRSISVVRDRLTHDWRTPGNSAFELFGCDLILSSDMTPHLVEINKGPALKATCDRDRQLKRDVLYDTLSLVESRGGASSGFAPLSIGSLLKERCPE